MIWGKHVYRDPPLAFYHQPDGTMKSGHLLDFDLEIIDNREGSVTFVIRNSEVEWCGMFTLEGNDLF